MTGTCRSIRVSFEPTCSLVPVHSGELDVHENEIGPVGGCCGKACLTVFGFDDLEVSAREQIPQDLPIVQLILYHQDALAHDGPLAFRPAPAA